MQSVYSGAKGEPKVSSQKSSKEFKRVQLLTSKFWKISEMQIFTGGLEGRVAVAVSVQLVASGIESEHWLLVWPGRCGDDDGEQ